MNRIMQLMYMHRCSKSYSPLLSRGFGGKSEGTNVSTPTTQPCIGYDHRGSTISLPCEELRGMSYLAVTPGQEFYASDRFFDACRLLLPDGLKTSIVNFLAFCSSEISVRGTNAVLTLTSYERDGLVPVKPRTRTSHEMKRLASGTILSHACKFSQIATV